MYFNIGEIMINVLAIGDVVGKLGRETVFSKLPGLIEEYNAFFTVVNGENATTGNGINEKYAYKMLECGADVITLGNHAYSKPEINNMLECSDRIIRPLNYPADMAGDGVTVIEKDNIKLGVINIMGKTYMDGKLSCPFKTLDKAVENLKRRYDDLKCIIVDFHAEATSEKKALGFYMDGKISAIYGTHTHVQTNDKRVLDGGTGYVTDIGMTGSYDSVIGLKKEIAIPRFLGEAQNRFRWAEERPMINAAVFKIDENTGKTLEITLINKDV